MKTKELKRISFINNQELPKTFSIRASLILKVNDKFLMVKNENDSRFKHPGGHVNLSESIPEALSRELKEELGIVFSNLPKEPEFFDKVLHEDNIMINSYFTMEIGDQLAISIINQSPLIARMFRYTELTDEITYESEIRAIDILSQSSAPNLPSK